MSNYSYKDNSDHKYFSMIPHLITEIGLKGNEIAVYVAIKRSAGETSVCTKAKEKLCKHAGISPRTLFTVIKKLCQVNSFLKKPLIICTERFNEKGDQETNLIEIVDIWPEATNFLNKIINRDAKFARPPHAKFARPPMQNLPDPHAKFAYKEEPFKKNPLKKTTTQNEIPKDQKPIAAAVFSCLIEIKDDSITKKDKEAITKKYLNEEKRVKDAVACVTRKGFEPAETLLKSLWSACRDEWKPLPKKEDRVEKNRRFAEDVKKNYKGRYTIEVLNKQFEIIKGGQCIPEVFLYETPHETFKTKIKEILKIKE